MITAYSKSEPFKYYESERIVTTDSRNPNPVVYKNLNSLTYSSAEFKSGYRNSDFRQQIAKGIDASSAYTLRRIKSLHPGFIRVTGETSYDFEQSYRYRISQSGDFVVVGQPNLLYTSDSETYNRALASIKRQLNQRSGRGSFAPPLAESKELGRLVQQAVLTSTNFVKGVLNAKRTMGRSVFRNMQKNWLGYSFALKPLVNDISDLGQSIASYYARADLSTRLKATATKRGTYTYVPSSSVSSVPLGMKPWARSAEAHYTLSYTFTGAFDLNFRSNVDYTLLTHLGLGLEAIPLVAWELTAFSWMADYFFGIQGCLEDVFYSPPGTTRYLVSSRKYECDMIHNFKLEPYMPNPNGMMWPTTVAQATWSYVEFTRTPLAALPHASMYLKSASTIGRDAIPKLLNLISLLRV